MEEVLPANFEQTDPLASDIVFTAQVDSMPRHAFRHLIQFR